MAIVHEAIRRIMVKEKQTSFTPIQMLQIFVGMWQVTKKERESGESPGSLSQWNKLQSS